MTTVTPVVPHNTVGAPPLSRLWRQGGDFDLRFRRIREKIEPDPENPRYLKTVRGAGYRFEAPK